MKKVKDSTPVDATSTTSAPLSKIVELYRSPVKQVVDAINKLQDDENIAKIVTIIVTKENTEVYMHSNVTLGERLLFAKIMDMDNMAEIAETYQFGDEDEEYEDA